MVSLAYTTVTNNALVIPPPNSFYFDFDKDETLARRYSKKGYLLENLTFEFTRDRGLLHQYYEIRKNEYNAVYSKLFHVDKNYYDGESDHDRSGHIMVVRGGNFCVGGVRININTPRKPQLLPVEIEDFRVEKYFPQLRHKQMSYGQVSGFALLPEFRGGEITLEMFRNIYRKATVLNLGMLFADTSPIHARLYHTNCAAIGLKDIKIHSDIRTPDPDIHRVLFSAVIEKPHKYPADLITSTENHLAEA